MGEKSESGGKRGERKWTAGLVQEGPVCIHLVPIEQRTTERVATQDRQGGEVMTGTHVVEECPKLDHGRYYGRSGKRP